jgi:hypothetical protein
VASHALSEVRDHLFATRTNRVAVSDNLLTAARKLISDYLRKAHPDPFTEEQILYVAPISPVCNDVWVLWESGRKIMIFSADTDLSNPGFAQLSQLRLQVIDLDKDVVASTWVVILWSVLLAGGLFLVDTVFSLFFKLIGVLQT